MTKEALWETYVHQYPSFGSTGATFTAAGLRRFFEVTWEQGHAQGVDNGRALEKRDAEKVAPPRTTPGSDPLGIFREVLGGKKP